MTTMGDTIAIGGLYIRDLTAYDASGSAITIPFSLTGNTLRMTLPIQWLQNESTIYPIVIDPTISTNLSIAADLHVIDDFSAIPPAYNRASTGIRLNIGYNHPCSFPATCLSSRARSTIDWNLGNIPDNAQIIDINLTLYASSAGSSTNSNISISHMDGNSSSYPDDSSVCGGNCQYYKDMGNGTNYTTTAYFSTGAHYFNVSNATADVFAAFSNDSFSIGIFSKIETGGANPNNYRVYASSEAADPAQRPVLVIKYFVSGANETAGDDAITQGILNALPVAAIHPEQQAYIRSSSGTQQLGRFDQIAVFNNQRWAFNYITSGESFMNMNNISTNFYTLELIDLFSNDITTQVSAFINATKQ